MQVQLGRWIAANTPPGARIALNDVGAIAYVSRREVVDVMGLVTPAIIAYRQGRRGRRPPLPRAHLSRLPRHLPRVVSDALGDDGPLPPDLPDPPRPQHGRGGGRDGRLQDAVDLGPLPMMVARGEARIMPVMKRLVVVAAVIATVALGDARPAGRRGAEAQVFRWIDGEGIIHYSQGIESVPPRFRQGAVIIGYERTGTAPRPWWRRRRWGSAACGSRRASPSWCAVRINGATPATLMLDTGATRTVINPRVLEAIGVSYRDAQRGTIRGVTGEAPVLAVRVESIEASGARSRPPPGRLPRHGLRTGRRPARPRLPRSVQRQHRQRRRARHADPEVTPGRTPRLPETSTGASV